MASRPLQVGISIIPDTDSLERSLELVRVADDGGLAFVGVQDHPYQHHFFDTWSLIPTLLAETKRISFFTDVASLPLRPPAQRLLSCSSLNASSGACCSLGSHAVAAHDRCGIDERDALRRTGWCQRAVALA